MLKDSSLFIVDDYGYNNGPYGGFGLIGSHDTSSFLCIASNEYIKMNNYCPSYYTSRITNMDRKQKYWTVLGNFQTFIFAHKKQCDSSARKDHKDGDLIKFI